MCRVREKRNPCLFLSKAGVRGCSRLALATWDYCSAYMLRALNVNSRVLAAQARAPVEQLGPAAQPRQCAGDSMGTHGPVCNHGGGAHTGGEAASPLRCIFLVHAAQR